MGEFVREIRLNTISFWVSFSEKLFRKIWYEAKELQVVYLRASLSKHPSESDLAYRRKCQVEFPRVCAQFGSKNT